jgi:hypothetical protein
MPGLLARHLLPLLQLTRMALVFTAISNSLCSVVLLAWMNDQTGGSHWADAGWLPLAAVVVMSIGMYGFGMSLNDIIDRRRDAKIAAHRPLPSGRIGVLTAHIICGLLAGIAVAATCIYAYGTSAWPMSLFLCLWTLLLIVFYDLAGKYLVAPGLLCLGLIRFFHAVIAVPQLPLLWHPLWLLNHVVILSAVCYVLEEKRPTLNRKHWAALIGGLLLINVLSIAAVMYRRLPRDGDWVSALDISPGLLFPAFAAAGFVILVSILHRAAKDARGLGQTLMLVGLLWLIMYDSAFLIGYVGWTEGLLHLLLMPIAYAAVLTMRGWSRLVALSHTPEFQRVR